jgi:hypothetical protein
MLPSALPYRAAHLIQTGEFLARFETDIPQLQRVYYRKNRLRNAAKRAFIQRSVSDSNWGIASSTADGLFCSPTRITENSEKEMLKIAFP